MFLEHPTWEEIEGKGRDGREGKKKKRNNEKPNVRLKAGGEGIRGWPAATLEA